MIDICPVDKAGHYHKKGYVDMNNDLISRSALREEVKTLFCPDGYKIMMLDRIDNAPAVEAVSLEHHNKIKGFLDNEVKSLVDILDKGRPQGEWIDTGSGQECNVCHEIQYGYDNFRHFCANCGAKMKGGAE